MRIIPLAACSVLVLLSPAVHAEYREIWNPPEARGTAPSSAGAHTVKPVKKPVSRTVRPVNRTKAPVAHAKHGGIVNADAPVIRNREAATRTDVPVLRAKDLPPMLAPDGSVLTS
jgi:predicted lipid-binding transport protein (Tim44 family)